MEEGVNWFGGAFAFNGMQRWQLWFDNPNKAAVFLAEMSLLGLCFVFTEDRKKAVWGLLFSLLPSLALVHTFSRGGLVAWLVSALVILVRHVSSKVALRRVAVVLGMMALVLVAASYRGLSCRMADGVFGNDRSVRNRLEVWSHAAQMLHDAPFGWGVSSSGSAYMDWYQPLEHDERYRTLVNSHFTWMVETGWAGTVAWVILWLALLAFGYNVGRSSGRWICFAECLCLFTSGIFSSVMESAWLWMIPVGTLVSEIVIGGGRGFLLAWRSLLFGMFTSVPVAVACFALVSWKCDAARIKKSAGGVAFLGLGGECWILADKSILGGDHYPRVLRRAAIESEIVTFRIVDDSSCLPENVNILSVCGDADARGRRGVVKTIWLSPSNDQKIANGDIVVRGEFSESWPCLTGVEVITIPSVSDYIADWPVVLSSITLANMHSTVKEVLTD